MEENNELREKAKRFNSSFLTFIFSQFFLVVSSLDVASRFKVLSLLFEILGLFSIVAYFLFALSVFKLRRINHQFFLSLVTIGLLFTSMLVRDICKTSTDDFYLIWGNALDWTARCLLCVFYIYFFLGVHNFFKEIGVAKENKNHLAVTISFISLFVLERLLVFLLFFDGIKFNMITNRICTYGKMILTIAIYIYVLVISIVIKVRYHNKVKEVYADEKSAQ